MRFHDIELPSECNRNQVANFRGAEFLANWTLAKLARRTEERDEYAREHGRRHPKDAAIAGDFVNMSRDRLDSVMAAGRPHGRLELLVFDVRATQREWPQVTNLPLLLAVTFNVTQEEGESWTLAAINDWGEYGIGSVFLGPPDWMEQVSGEVVCPLPKPIGTDVSEQRLFIGATSQVRGRIAERWGIWSRFRHLAAA